MKAQKFMNNIDIQYQNLLKDILSNGVKKQDRTGTGTISVFGRQIRHQMSEGFPLLTTKKMYFNGVAAELIWFLRGDTNIKFLLDNNCHIWDGDCYASYEKKITRMLEEGISKGWTISDWDKVTLPKNLESSMGVRLLTKEEFIGKIQSNDSFSQEWGDLGPIYGKQWRSWGNEEEFHNGSEYMWYGPKDQIQDAIETLKTNPDSRRIMVNAWNVQELKEMILPPCHYGFQIYTRELTFSEKRNLLFSNHPLDSMPEGSGSKPMLSLCDEYEIPTRAISLMWNQRSVDTFLGLPFNIASYALLLEIIAKEVNMIPDELIGNLGDVHLYLNHIDQAREQISRNPYELPKLCLDYREGEYNKNLKNFVVDDFVIFNYKSHPAIKAPLSN
jgi:thymidylate synthase